MLSQFTKYIGEGTQPADHFIVAVSGGVDSVVLCHLCRRAGLSFSLAHCNFGLRGVESDRDERFVHELAQQYGVPFYTKLFDTEAYARQHKLSVQEAARNLRYEWFALLKKETGARYVLLAHHADDAVETALMHYFRGTGLAGLTGISEYTPGKVCLRPLLHVTRQQIIDYATENNLGWVEDSSNSSSKYARNFFRNELIPAIEKIYPGVRGNLMDNLNRLRTTKNFYDQSVALMKTKLVKKENGVDAIPVLQLTRYADTSFIYEVLKDYGFGEKQVPEILKLSRSETGSFIESQQFRIIRNRRWFLMVPKTGEANQADAAETVLIQDGVSEVLFAGGRLQLKRMDAAGYSLNAGAASAALDAATVQFPLLLRKWKPGDYFYPLGLGKKKKLSRFFIDRKLSLAEKEKTWVLQSGEKIIWVIGHRIDDRFKITPKTREVLQITAPNP